MSSPIITVENLSKRYVIGHKDASADGLRHVLDGAIRNPVRWLTDIRRRAREAREEFWALKDVSFEIEQGEVVGIIGRNGAGKSTLLKVLSRITEPTSGRIRGKGRIASLLEVGTCFHQELTGRENIFLNGAILGMKRAEIKSKFDEIVAFSEIERFIDTPVKRYESGLVRPPRICGRGSSRTGNSGYRPGLGRRGCSIPAQVHGPDGGSRQAWTNRALREP